MSRYTEVPSKFDFEGTSGYICIVSQYYVIVQSFLNGQIFKSIESIFKSILYDNIPKHIKKLYHFFMQSFPPTCILRHQRENLKKCSLRGLEIREDFSFFTYPTSSLPDISSYLLLAMDAPNLQPLDRNKGVFLLDATWRYAAKMLHFVEAKVSIEKRSIPPGFRTAYPRKQNDCPNPEEGLASIEALYIAYVILGRDPQGLLDGYYWKNAFLKTNEDLLKSYSLWDGICRGEMS